MYFSLGLLGVKHDSSLQEIKRAYYLLAQKAHPDVNQAKGSVENFAKINNAYQILSDDQKRREYDRDQQFQHAATSNYSQSDFFGRKNTAHSGQHQDFRDFGNTNSTKNSFSFEDFFQFDEEVFREFIKNTANQHNNAKNQKKNNEKTKEASSKKNKFVYNDVEFDFLSDEEDINPQDFFKNPRNSKKNEGFSQQSTGSSSTSGSSKEKRKKGQDSTSQVYLTFDESLTGVTRVVDVEKKILCEKCQGTKKALGSKKKLCKTCKGSGTLTFKQGIHIWEMVCSDCHGAGQIFENPCKYCQTTGFVTKVVKETIHVPRGVNNGQTIRFPNQGNASDRGGVAGDLVIKVKVANDKSFKKEGFDLFSEHTISPARAVLGGKIKVKSMKGEIEVVLQPGTQDGYKMKIPGQVKNHQMRQVARDQSKVFNLNLLELVKGIDREGTKDSGDQFVVFRIQIPKTPSEEEKMAYQQLLDLE